MSSASISPGDVWNGSNSSKCPSAVGTATRAARCSGNDALLGEVGGEGVVGWVGCEADWEVVPFRVGINAWLARFDAEFVRE